MGTAPANNNDVNSSGSSCKTQDDCPAGYTCRHGTCWFLGNSSESPESPVNNQSDADVNSSGKSCKTQDDCPAGYTCRHGTCWFLGNSSESSEFIFIWPLDSHHEQELHI